MPANWPGTDAGFWQKKYVNFIYIPSGLLLLGCAITKPDWLQYAAGVAVLLGSWQYYDMQPRKTLHPRVFQEFPLIEKTILSHNVAIYRFSLPSPTSILGLPIGQHITVAAKLSPEDKLPTRRSYTPISSDDQRGSFDLLVKSYPQGNISKHMASLQVGQTLQFMGPKGAMVYRPNMVARFGMIAGGTGITPMLQIIRAIIRGRSKNGGTDVTQIDLIFANVNHEDILLKEDLDELAGHDTGFSIYYVLNNPPEKWEGGVGFVTEQMIKDKLPPPADDIQLLVCGPPPMVSAMKKATLALGYDKTSPVSKLHDQVFCF